MESTKLKHLVCIVTVLFLPISGAFAQTFSEWFSQKKTQKKYLIEQIAALKVYAGYLKKGYDIADQGINTVKDIKNGEFNLHSVFIGSLRTVSPAIRNGSTVADIIAFQLEISKTLNSLKHNEWLPASHQSYIKDVKNKVMGECENDLEELLLILTSGKVEMTDDERIKRLNKVYVAMQDKAAFTQSFYNQVHLFIRQNEHLQKSINQLKKYYGIID